jgi:hypothetical protein
MQIGGDSDIHSFYTGFSLEFNIVSGDASEAPGVRSAPLASVHLALSPPLLVSGQEIKIDKTPKAS